MTWDDPDSDPVQDIRDMLQREFDRGLGSSPQYTVIDRMDVISYDGETWYIRHHKDYKISKWISKWIPLWTPDFILELVRPIPFKLRVKNSVSHLPFTKPHSSKGGLD